MNERVEKVKAHLKANQKIYIAAGIGVVVGVFIGAGGTMYLTRNSKKITQVINNTVAPVFNNDNSSTVNLGGHLHKIVKCIETGEIWEKATSAAESAGVSAAMMSRHLNGHHDHINNLHYEIIGLGTS